MAGMRLCFLTSLLLALGMLPAHADSTATHQQVQAERPLPWPGGVIPYDLSRLSPDQQAQAMTALGGVRDGLDRAAQGGSASAKAALTRLSTMSAP